MKIKVAFRKISGIMLLIGPPDTAICSATISNGQDDVKYYYDNKEVNMVYMKKTGGKRWVVRSTKKRYVPVKRMKITDVTIPSTVLVDKIDLLAALKLAGVTETTVNKGNPTVKVYDNDGYKYARVMGCLMVHRLLGRLYFGELPKGSVIHHIDGNSLNNSKDNLCVMSNEEHVRHHTTKDFWEMYREKNYRAALTDVKLNRFHGSMDSIKSINAIIGIDDWEKYRMQQYRNARLLQCHHSRNMYHGR